MSNVYPTKPERLDFTNNDSQYPSIDALRKGSTFSRILTVDDLDLTDHELRMSVKETYDSTAILVLESTELSSTQPRITIEVTDGTSVIDLIVPSSVTETLDAGSSTNCIPRQKRYWYDMEIITPSNEVYAFLEGEFFIVDELTTET